MEIIKFYTPTCMPCKVVGKILSKLEGVKITEIDATEDIAAVDKYNVCTTPTLIFIKDDVEIGRLVGMTTESHIRGMLNLSK